MIRTSIVAMLVLLMTGCSLSVPMATEDADKAAKQFQPVPGKATVYIYRNEWNGGMIRMGLYVDGQPVAQTAKYTYVLLHLEPGKHVIRGHAHNNSEVTLDAKAGEVHFIWQEVTLGSGAGASNELRIVDAKTGREGVMDCDLAAPREYKKAASRDNEQRLLELKKLRDQGLISEEEYQQKRDKVLEGI